MCWHASSPYTAAASESGHADSNARQAATKASMRPAARSVSPRFLCARACRGAAASTVRNACTAASVAPCSWNSTPRL